ncbi:MAG: zinc dependent phospholipase C family protein [Chitinophagaceae bacterium]
MKRKYFKKILPLIAMAISAVTLLSWGVWGHEHINHAAVFALPQPMRLFFYNHIDFITEESSVPDIRKYTINDKAEFARHFINIESYKIFIDSLPKTMKGANEKFDSLFLQKNGILPWYIQDMMQKLTNAFKNKQKTEILFLAADLGHYLADANMPLHTSVNHDGQFTNQKGIHAFWESQLPELFGDNYNFKVDDAKYINDVTTETWNIIKKSHQLVDTLLFAEKRLHDIFPKNKIYETDSKDNNIKNKFGQPVHSFAYAQAYNKTLNGMIEKQLRNSIQDVANFWYTAWINAGKPDLSSLDPQSLTKQNRKQYKIDLRLYGKGKLSGFKVNNEFSH